jgi:putative two-component system response regulator
MGAKDGEIDDRFIRDIGRGVVLHDIGKVAVPEHILLKPGRLTDEEMAIMRTHPKVGAETIRAVVSRTSDVAFLHMAEAIVYGHHEWFNGTGYPRGLKGPEIPLSARIAAVADVYDALTTKRPYKEAMDHDKAVTIVTELSGTQLDPVVVEAFLAREQEFAALAAELADDPAGGGLSEWLPSSHHVGAPYPLEAVAMAAGPAAPRPPQ